MMHQKKFFDSYQLDLFSMAIYNYLEYCYQSLLFKNHLVNHLEQHHSSSQQVRCFRTCGSSSGSSSPPSNSCFVISIIMVMAKVRVSDI